jgi:hypothetical protein
MRNHYDDIADSSRDVGSWAADASDFSDVDMVSSCMKVMIAMTNAMSGREHVRKVPTDADPFDIGEMVAPPVIGL